MPHQDEMNITALTSISYLTLNLFIRPPLITNNGNDYKTERLSYFKSHVLNNFDVITLQEAFRFGSNRIFNLEKYAVSLGFKCTHLKGGLFGIDGGVMILSRYPITSFQQYLYKSAAESDKLSYKGAIYTRIQINPDTHLNLFSTHLQASYKDNLPLTDPSVKSRLEQLSELFGFVEDQKIDPKESIMIAGDLNINSRQDPFDDSKENTTEEYIKMKEIMNNKLKNWSFEDLIFQELNYHPVTFGDYEKIDGKYVPKETVLTGKDCLNSGQSLDYVFLGKSNQTIDKFKTKTKIENFFIDKDEFKPLTQVSDHYGLSVELNFL